MKNSSEEMYLAAKTLFDEGEYSQAIGILESIIAKDSEYLLAYCSLGRAYAERGEYHKAEQLLLKAAKSSPNWHLPHLCMGWVYEQQQEMPQALAAYERAVKLKPDDFDSRAYLGYMYQRLDNQENAVKEFQAAYQLNSYDATLTYHLIRCLLSLGQTDDALSIVNEVLLDSSNLDAQTLAYFYQLRGIAFYNKGKLDEANADIEKGIELNPTEFQFYIELGDVYFEKGQYKEAINSYKQALGSENVKGQALKGIGLSYLYLENWQETVNALEKAKQLEETVSYGLGFAYFELGEDEQGIDYFKKEIQNDGPSKIEASYYLGFAYVAVGDQTSSIQTFKQFLELTSGKPGWDGWRLDAQKEIDKQELKPSTDSENGSAH